MSNQNQLTYTISEVAKLLKVSRPTIYKCINERRLQSYKEGRRRLVTATAVSSYLAEKMTQGDE